MTADSFRVLICSDFHAYDSNAARSSPEQPPSIYNISGPDTECPVRKFVRFLSANSIKADLLICPGDLADKACPNGLSAAWKALQQIKEEIEASQLAVTAGNHDLDSRYAYNDHDAKGMLQSLDPPFPIDNESQFNEYWARHIFFLDGDDWRVCVLNSSAYHGSQEEHKYGRISKSTLSYLKRRLAEIPAKTINLLVCHHPPHDQTENQQGSGDRIHFGDDLLELLGSGHHGQWIVIYGHKHYPKLEYARGGDAAPILISSASLTALPYLKYGPNGTNQFHVLEFTRESIERFGVVFRMFSYQWSLADGEWKPASYDRGLPRETGIGYHINIDVGAARIALLLRCENELSWEHVLDELNEFRFVSIETLRPILIALKNNHGIVAEFADEDYRSKLVKLVKA